MLELELPNGYGEASVSIVSGANVTAATPAAVFQWQSATVANGPFTNISGANNTIYAINDSYDSTRPYLRVELLYTHNTEDVRVTVYSPTKEGVRLPQLSLILRSAQASVSVVNANVIDATPAAVYQWQNATAADTTFEDITGVTGETYDVPITYGVARPFLRMRLNYTHNESSVVPRPRDAFSPAVRVAGVASGTVSFALAAAPNVGGVVNSDISELRDVLGRVVRAEDLTYQWYRGNGVTPWDTIDTNGTGASYTIAAADFTNTKRLLSLQVTDPAGVSGPFNPEGINLQRDTSGAVVLDVPRISVGATITANTRNIIDENGVGTYTYAWYYVRDGGTEQLIGGASDVTLIIDNTELPSGSAALSVIVSVVHTDELGFKNVLATVASALTDSASSGDLLIDTVPLLRGGGKLTANVSGISDANGVDDYAYQWQQQISGGSWTNVTNGIGGDANIYTLPTSGWDGVPMLRVSAVHTDGLGYTADFVSPALVINREPTGKPFVVVVGGGAAILNAVVSVDTDGIGDTNNETGQNGTYSFQWQSGGDVNKGGQTNREYTLTEADISAIALGNAPKVLVTLTDSLGFTFGWVAEVRAVDARISQSGAVLSATVFDPGTAVKDGTERYQWLQSATDDGTYNDISGATNAEYTIPTDYGVTSPFVRVSVDYTNTSSGSDVVTNVVSSPQRVAGVQSGAVGIATPTNVDVGGVINSNISNLLDVLGRAVRAADLTYQWYSGDGTTWRVIATNGTGASYTIVATDFDNTNSQLSLQVTDPAGLQTSPLGAAAINLQRGSTGNAVLSATESRLSIGATLNADVSSIADLNGNGANTYAWYYARGGAPQQISGADNATLIIANVPIGSGALRVIVSLTHTDALGFETALAGVEFALTDSASSGALAIDSNSVRGGGQLTADVSSISDTNGIGPYTYQWQQQSAGSSSWTNVTNGIGGDTNTYTLPASGWDGVPMLRVSVVHTDGLGYLFTITSPPLVINREPTNKPFVMLIDGAAREGATARVDTGNIADTNNATGQNGTYAYQWQDFDGTDKTSSATGRDYILTAADLTAIRASKPPKVLVTLTDSLGFRFGWEAEVRVVDAQIKRTGGTGAQLAATLADPGRVVVTDSESYQWQQSATNGGTYTPISGVGDVDSYAVPTDYGTSHPFVRVSIGYMDSSSGTNVATSAISSPLRVAGVASGGTADIATPTNVGVGGVINSDISELRDVLGRAVRAADLTYKWYSGNGTTWTAIASNGTNASYSIATGDFNNTKRQLSLRVTDRAGSSGPFNPTGIDLQRVPTGDLSIDASLINVGATITVNTRSIRDANGLGTYVYAWYIVRGSGARQLISGAANATLIIASTDLPDGSGAIRVVASVTHTDALRFESVFADK